TTFGWIVAAHSRDGSQSAVVWVEYPFSGGINITRFAFIDNSTGAFTGSVETLPIPGNIGSFDPGAFGLVFDESGNPKVVYRVSGTTAQESGTGARRIRSGGSWGAEQTFAIDGMTEPDAIQLVEGEDAFTQTSAPGGDLYAGTYAVGGDHHALKRVAAPFTFRYRTRVGGSWLERDINFATLARPISGPNTDMYILHGMARQIYALRSLVASVVWTANNFSGAGDLWF